MFVVSSKLGGYRLSRTICSDFFYLPNVLKILNKENVCNKNGNSRYTRSTRILPKYPQISHRKSISKGNRSHNYVWQVFFSLQMELKQVCSYLSLIYNMTSL